VLIPYTVRMLVAPIVVGGVHGTGGLTDEIFINERLRGASAGRVDAGDGDDGAGFDSLFGCGGKC